MARARVTVEAVRPQDRRRVPIEVARERIEHQGRRDGHLGRDRRGLRRRDGRAAGRSEPRRRRRPLCRGRVGTGALLDPISAGLGDRDVELIIDARRCRTRRCAGDCDPPGRNAAPSSPTLRLTRMPTASPAERGGRPHRVDPGAAFGRTGHRRPPAIEPAQGRDLPPLSAETVRAVIRARRLRAAISPKNCSPIPRGTCCSICCRRRSRTAGAGIEPVHRSGGPATTALRWLKTWSARDCSCAAPTRTTAAGCSSNWRPRQARRCGAISRSRARSRRSERLPYQRRAPLAVRQAHAARAVSSVGRASRLHREGRRFEPVTAHHPPRGMALLRYGS